MAETTGVALIDFETGDTSQCTSVVEEGSNTFAAGAGGALHGSYGGIATFDGTNNDAYGVKTFDAASEMYARCYLKFSSDYDSNTGLGAVLGFNSELLAVARITTYDSGTGLTWRRLYYRTDAGETYTALGDAVTLDQTYLLEIHFKAASGDGNNDGEIHCWIDGTEEVALTNVDNDTITVDRLSFGQFNAQVPTVGSIIYVDDVKMDTSRIGAYSDAGGGSVVPVIMAQL